MKQLFILFIFSLLLVSCSRNLQQSRIVLLPDTQTYAEKYPQVLDSQINWLLKESKSIAFVLQQGDITQNNNDKEWTVVQKAFSKLNGKLPYVLAAGNHDMGSADGKFADVRNTSKYNQYFPLQLMQQQHGFGGTAEGKMENAYYRFTTGKQNWLVLTLEFGPRNSILQWADQIITQNSSHTVIINTHSYMYSDSTRQGPGDSWRPQNYGVGKDTGDASVNDGEQIWNKLVRKHSNIRFVFSGHVLNTGVGTLVSVNDAGYPVYQMLANYQEGVKGSVMGGNGWLRIIDLDAKRRTIQVRTYSPFLNAYMNDPQHNFIIRNVIF